MDRPFGYTVGDTWGYLEEPDGREGWNGGWDASRVRGLLAFRCEGLHKAALQGWSTRTAHSASPFTEPAKRCVIDNPVLKHRPRHCPWNQLQPPRLPGSHRQDGETEKGRGVNRWEHVP